MLSKLEISNLAIIEKLSIDFSSGFNVITGETGAGKSIMIKALQLILGGKSNGDMVRNGSTLASVSALFLIDSSHPSIDIMEDLGLYDCSEQSCEILIRRTVSSKGRSQAWINDTLVTSATLKKLGLTLIDIFGQNDSSKLLDPNKHVHLLDQFVDDEVKKNFIESYKIFEETFKTLKETLEEYVSKSSQEDYLLFRAKELDEFSPDESDYRELVAKSNHLREISKKKDRVLQLSGVLGGPSGVIHGLIKAEMDLPEITNLIPSLSENLEKITELRNVLEDTSFEVEKWLSKINESFEGLENTEQRISSYQGLFRKTSTRNIEELVSYIGEIKDELSKIKILDEKLRGLTSSLPVTVDALIMSSAKLTNAREQAAEKIAVEVANEFEELAMKGASISVKFLPVRSGFVLEHFDSLDEASRDIWADSCEKTLGISSLGSERPVIHLSSNPGEEAKPLEKIASGGEISRIMLSLKRVLASGADACVLVFDEIDSGISGEVANKVGSKLKSLSKSFQIICISHLAQVASYGDRHFKVSKTQLDDRTFTSINALTDVQSTEELARLVSGEGITKASRDHARILKDKAKNI